MTISEALFWDKEVRDTDLDDVANEGWQRIQADCDTLDIAWSPVWRRFIALTPPLPSPNKKA